MHGHRALDDGATSHGVVANSDPEQNVWMEQDRGEDGMSHPRIFST